MIKIFIKYPKIKIFGDRSNEGILAIPGQICIQEKVDGANFGFYVEDDVLWFSSHNQNLTDSEQIAKTGIPKGWKGIDPVMKSWENDPTMFNPNLYYYGESLQKHTISYDDIPGFVGFDILDINDDKFLDWNITKRLFKNMNLSFINVICELSTDKEITIDYLKSLYEKSAYKEGSAEGIVIKNYDKQLFAKIVDDKFKEQNRSLFGHDNEPKKLTNENKIVEIYATPARIEKCIYKMKDEGFKIEMSVMPILYKLVVEDILEEEILNIYNNFNTIDFKQLNKLISKECAVILKRVIMNQQKSL